jgi:hypothetical protein
MSKKKPVMVERGAQQRRAVQARWRKPEARKAASENMKTFWARAKAAMAMVENESNKP